jgi:hypothetical protein
MSSKLSVTISFDEEEEEAGQKSPDESESHEKRKQASEGKPLPAHRVYLPILNIGNPEAWPSQPSENRKHLTPEVAFSTCLGNCCGVENLKDGCCQLDPTDLEQVLGSVTERWISSTLHWFRKNGIKMTREDIVIDMEEGQVIGEKFFSGHPAFKSKKSYPMLRFQVFGSRYACKFLNPKTGMCTIYDRRPDMCRDYYCQYIKANFLVKTKELSTSL